MFMPLYIGGCLANDQKITLGQLFVLNKNGDDGGLHLQYVHDFGDWVSSMQIPSDVQCILISFLPLRFNTIPCLCLANQWSHSICVTKYEEDVPNNATVAHLVGGKGGSIPDDAGGIIGYAEKISQLIGRQVGPNSERWWDLVNDLRGSSNRLGLLSNPLVFDVEMTRAAIETAIRAPTHKAGREDINTFSMDTRTGLTHEFNKKCTVSSPKSKTKLCAVCGVTVALKLCSRCSGVAYCSREHQLEHWGMHKSECKQIRKEKEGK